MRGVASERIQADEIWSFCYAKQKNDATAKATPKDFHPMEMVRVSGAERVGLARDMVERVRKFYTVESRLRDEGCRLSVSNSVERLLCGVCQSDESPRIDCHMFTEI